MALQRDSRSVHGQFQVADRVSDGILECVETSTCFILDAHMRLDECMARLRTLPLQLRPHERALVLDADMSLGMAFRALDQAAAASRLASAALNHTIDAASDREARLATRREKRGRLALSGE